MSQLALPIIHLPDNTFENFISETNKLVSVFLTDKITALSSTLGSLEIVYLHNKEAVGKTHLLHACCRYAESLKLASVYLDCEYLTQMPPEILTDIEENELICIDNLHVCIASEDWQLAMFDLINKLREKGDKVIVFAASKKPDALEFSLPDLISRLNWGTRFKLKEYSDDDKIEILMTHADERGFTLSAQCCRYILKTCNRDLHQLLAIVDVIDNFSLQEKRYMTIPLLKKALGQA